MKLKLTPKYSHSIIPQWKLSGGTPRQGSIADSMLKQIADNQNRIQDFKAMLYRWKINTKFHLRHFLEGWELYDSKGNEVARIACYYSRVADYLPKKD